MNTIVASHIYNEIQKNKNTNNKVIVVTKKQIIDYKLPNWLHNLNNLFI